jgi:ceramide glucosyltransferase
MAALGWWLAAYWLVRRCRRAPPLAGPRLAEMISIFKPLPRLGSGGASAGLREALHSFARQLDAEAELLLGLHEEDRAIVQPWIEQLQAAGPGGSVRVFYRSGAHTHANAKISWLEWLAPHARGAWWLWSDADIVAPAGWLDQARRAALALPGANLVTFPYYVRWPTHLQSWWDAAFVNAEMLPGACLMVVLRREVNFAFGAAMLFRREIFLSKCDWSVLGRHLADDFAVGRALERCRVALPALETLAEENTWGGALRHYQRWHKTIRWCQPVGYACQILINPLLGWLVAAMIFPTLAIVWLGLLLQYVIEVLVVLLLNGQASGRWFASASSLIILATWPALRTFMWVSSWLPFGVHWRERRWRGLQQPDR